MIRFDPHRNMFSNRVLRWIYGDRRIGGGAVRRWLRPRIKDYDVRYRGLKWRIHPADNSIDRSIWLRGQSNEEAEIEYLTSRFAGCQICFFDIGANCGLYAMCVGQALAPESRIFAVEPNPIMCERLRINLALNDVVNTEVLECAIAAERGQMRLRFPESPNFARVSLHTAVGTRMSDFKVKVMPLADLVNEHRVEKIDLLKIDVEGFEDRVLSPYLDTVCAETLPDVILLEHKHRNLWQTNLLEKVFERGYVVATENDTNCILQLGDRR